MLSYSKVLSKIRVNSLFKESIYNDLYNYGGKNKNQNKFSDNEFITKMIDLINNKNHAPNDALDFLRKYKLQKLNELKNKNLKQEEFNKKRICIYNDIKQILRKIRITYDLLRLITGIRNFTVHYNKKSNAVIFDVFTKISTKQLNEIFTNFVKTNTKNILILEEYLTKDEFDFNDYVNFILFDLNKNYDVSLEKLSKKDAYAYSITIARKDVIFAKLKKWLFINKATKI